MRSKAPLAMMEQMVMLLVFALAAALCLQAFVKSDRISRRSEERDKAAVLAQTAAEVIRSRGADTSDALIAAAEVLGAECEQGILWLDYDENWNPGGDVYRLAAQGVPVETPGLWKVNVWVDSESGERVIFSLEVAWQGEVSGHG